MTLTLAADALVAALLIAAIGYCAVLNRRLGALRSDRAALEEVIKGLHDCTVRAEAGITQLRATADHTGRLLQQKVEVGQGLREDLAYMIDRGNGLADRLDGAIRARRDAPAPVVEPSDRTASANPSAATTAAKLDEILRRAEEAEGGARAEPAAPSVAGFPSRAERELRRALDRARR